MTQLFEVVIFTASVSNYALPLVEKLDAKKYGFHVLSRRQCTLLNNNYFKDLSRLGRDLKDVIMIDNSPQAYAWQPANGIPIESWFEDTRDRELSKLVPVLERLAQVDDVRSYIPRVVDSHSVNYYEAFRVLKAPREPSPLDSFLKSWRNIKKNAAALFSGSSVTEGSKEDEVSKEEEKELPQLNPPKDLKDSKLFKGRNTIGGPIHQAMQQSLMLSPNQRPVMIKLAPKITLINKSGSEKIIDTENLDTISEYRDICNELISEEPKPLKLRYSDPTSVPKFENDQEDIKIVKEFNSINSDEPKSSSGKNDAETNDSGFKLSGVSQDKISEEKKDSQGTTPSSGLPKGNLKNSSEKSEKSSKALPKEEDYQSEEDSIGEDTPLAQMIHNSKLKTHFLEMKVLKTPSSEIRLKNKRNNIPQPTNDKNSLDNGDDSAESPYTDQGDFNISLAVYNSYTVRRERKKKSLECSTSGTKANSALKPPNLVEAPSQEESKQFLGAVKPGKDTNIHERNKRNIIKRVVKQSKSDIKPLEVSTEKKPTSSQILRKVLHKPRSDVKKGIKKPFEIPRKSETSHTEMIRESKWLSNKVHQPKMHKSGKLNKNMFRKIKSTQRYIHKGASKNYPKTMHSTNWKGSKPIIPYLSSKSMSESLNKF